MYLGIRSSPSYPPHTGVKPVFPELRAELTMTVIQRAFCSAINLTIHSCDYRDQLQQHTGSGNAQAPKRGIHWGVDGTGQDRQLSSHDIFIPCEIFLRKRCFSYEQDFVIKKRLSG